VDGSILLDDNHRNLEMRSYSDNELLSVSRRQSLLHPSQPSSETSSIAG